MQQNFDKDARISMAREFFSKLYRPATGAIFTYIWAARSVQGSKQFETHPFTVHTAAAVADAARVAIELNDRGYDVYFGVHLTFKFFKGGNRAKTADIWAQAAVITDIDIESPWHVSKEGRRYPPDIKTAAAFLPFEPTFLVDSGGGIHAYTSITNNDDFLALNDDNARAEAVKRNKAYIEAVRFRAGEFAGAVDGVGDLARVLRVPGTYNLKHGREGAPLCRVIQNTGRGYPVKLFDDKLAELTAQITAARAAAQTVASPPAAEFAAAHNLTPAPPPATAAAGKSSSAKVTSPRGGDPPEYETARVQAMLAIIDAALLTYDDWLAVMTACKALDIAYETVDAFNRRDPDRYDAVENRQHWNSLKDLAGYSIGTLHGIAKRFGYDEGAFKRQWYRDHPEYSRGTSKKTPRPIQRPYEPPAGVVPESKPVIADGADSKQQGLELPADLRDWLFTGGTTDLENARRLATVYGDKIRYVRDSGHWLLYEGGIWVDVGDSADALREFAVSIADSMAAVAKTEAQQELARGMMSSKKFSGAVGMLKGVSKVKIRQQDLDRHKELLNFRNCTVNLETGDVYEHRADDLLTQQCTCEYRLQGGEPYHNRLVEKFLTDVLPDEGTRAALLRFFGYALTAQATEDKFLFIDGTGANGKTSLTSAVLRMLAGYACAFPIDGVLMSGRTKDANAATPIFNMLLGRRVAISEEIPLGSRIDAAALKQLTGGGQIYIRQLHKEASMIDDPQHVMIFCGNSLPEIGDVHDEGILRRLLNISFTESFTGERANPKLKQQLQQPDALAGLATILVAEARNWYREGLLISSAMKAATAAYLRANDFLADFIEEHCTRNTSGAITRKEFLAKLKAEYPAACRGFSDRSLTDMIKRVDGIEYRERATRDKLSRFYGIEWLPGEEPDAAARPSD